MDPIQPATLTPSEGGAWALTGDWTLRGLGALPQQLDAAPRGAGAAVLDGKNLTAMDSAGAWVLQRWLGQAGRAGQAADRPRFEGWPPRMQAMVARAATMHDASLPPPAPGLLERTGRSAVGGARQALAMLVFMGQVAVSALGVAKHPGRLRWRTVLRHIEIAGFDALPIVGLTAFLIGVVVAYQGADQLIRYGANVFVVELVGHAMLREFAPLMTAIIIAGRSGSAYAAQIGTMVVTEEVDALRTLAIDPLELLVLPKLLALLVAVPLLTVFADITGVFGGMVMARLQLGIGWPEFAERFGREMQGSALLIGIGKSFVFATIIVMVGCFQGFRTAGGADSVGRQTTLSVVQAIFLVIVVDALFSVVFNILDL